MDRGAGDTYDVIVVGGGGAGLAAAVTACEAGARVLVAETADRLGGTTALSTGVFYAAGTQTQRLAGVEGDSPQAYFDYYLAVNLCRVEPALARIMCDRAIEGLAWLESLGVQFPPEGLYRSCISPYPRGHTAAGFGAAIASALERAARATGRFDVALESKVEDLLVDRGEITGVTLGGREIRAKAVILTTGGLGFSRAMWETYYPDALRHPGWAWPVSGPGCCGDGIRLGRQVGAAVQGHNAGSLSLTPGFSKRMELGGRQGWMIYVNSEGRRFVDERLVSYFQTKVVQAQPGGVCFAVFDEEIRKALQPSPPSPYSGFLFTDNWVAEKIESLADKGRVRRADTLEALARLCGIAKPRALENAVARYNEDVAQGRDSAFFKDPAALRRIATPPFYAVELRPAVVALTHAGVRIDPSARVMSEDEAPIPGLFAAGAATGNVMGEQYVGGGASIANAIVFGRIAGASAARRAFGRDAVRAPLYNHR